MGLPPRISAEQQQPWKQPLRQALDAQPASGRRSLRSFAPTTAGQGNSTRCIAIARVYLIGYRIPPQSALLPHKRFCVGVVVSAGEKLLYVGHAVCPSFTVVLIDRGVVSTDLTLGQIHHHRGCHRCLHPHRRCVRDWQNHRGRVDLD